MYDGSDVYVTEGNIMDAVKRTANCESEGDDVCYFKFREKMRSVPAIAYTIGLQTSNKVKELRNFLLTMPPMINVKSFTFQKQSSAQ